MIRTIIKDHILQFNYTEINATDLSSKSKINLVLKLFSTNLSLVFIAMFKLCKEINTISKQIGGNFQILSPGILLQAKSLLAVPFYYNKNNN